MIYSWQCFTIFILFIVIVPNSNAWITTSIHKQKVAETTESLPKDFLLFLNGLDKTVFKHEHPHISTEHTHKFIHKKMTTAHHKKLEEQNKPTKNDMFGDMLMMKLVSYYENKYNVGHDSDFEPLTIRTLAPYIVTTPDNPLRPIPLNSWSRMQQGIKRHRDARIHVHPWQHSHHANRILYEEKPISSHFRAHAKKETNNYEDSPNSRFRIQQEKVRYEDPLPPSSPETAYANLPLTQKEKEEAYANEPVQESYILQEPTEPLETSLGPDIVPEVMSL